MKIICSYKTFIMKRQWAVEKRSLNLVGPGQGQRPPVLFLYYI